jgi:putative membrane protein
VNEDDRGREQHELAVERTLEARRRTHLANERTYAAWIRTALALIGLGVGIAGYFHLVGDRRGRIFVVVGVTFVGAGAVMAALSTYVYRKTYHSIERGEYGSMATFTLILGAIPILLGLLALLLIIIG